MMTRAPVGLYSKRQENGVVIGNTVDDEKTKFGHDTSHISKE